MSINNRNDCGMFKRRILYSNENKRPTLPATTWMNSKNINGRQKSNKVLKKLYYVSIIYFCLIYFLFKYSQYLSILFDINYITAI